MIRLSSAPIRSDTYPACAPEWARDESNAGVFHGAESQASIPLQRLAPVAPIDQRPAPWTVRSPLTIRGRAGSPGQLERRGLPPLGERIVD
jgi:hypothetical protein